MIIGPFWCIESNAWLRFEIGATGLVRAQMALTDEDNRALTTSWQTVEPSIWHTFTLHEADSKPHQYYCLSGGVLYRYEGIRQLTNTPIISKFIPSDGWYAAGAANPFLDYSFPTTIPADDFTPPMSPEQQSIMWRIFQGKEDLHTLVIATVESGFNEEQQQELASFFPSLLNGELHPRNHSNYKSFLTKLRAAICDATNPHHAEILHQAARTVDYPVIESSGIPIETASVMKRNFFFNGLIALYNHIRQCYKLPAEPLTPPVVVVAPPPQPRAAIPAAGDDDDLDFLLSLLEMAQILPHHTAPQATVPSMLKRIKDAVATAQANYAEWYTGHHQHRGANGFFTWFRHGAYGQRRARAFKDTINNQQDEHCAISEINCFLNDKNTRYQRHSFASFLLDELIKIEDGIWSTLTCDAQTKRYSHATVSAQVQIAVAALS